MSGPVAATGGALRTSPAGPLGLVWTNLETIAYLGAQHYEKGGNRVGHADSAMRARAKSGLWRFGSFELDPERRELRNRGLRVKLSPQAVSALALLVEHAGELVTREELCSHLWPDGTHVDFEGNLNAIVRDVRGALHDSARSPRFVETELKRGYRFVAPVSLIPRPEEPSPPVEKVEVAAAPRARTGWIAAALAVLVVAGAGWYLLRNTRPESEQPARVRQLTNYLGAEGHPSFSPDGSRVAFHWNGDQTGGFNIYVKIIASGRIERLTDDPADDFSPAWSPDGRDIAFLRDLPEGSALMLVSALGGGERRVAVLPKDCSFTWSPDGRWIAYSGTIPNYVQTAGAAPGIMAISLESGATRRITSPGRAFLGDAFPAFSPDGRTLAFVRVSSIAADNIYTAGVDRDLRAQGEPRRITSELGDDRDLAWLSDREIVFSSARNGFYSLWKVAASGRGAVEPVGGENALEPSVDPATHRIAYSRLALVDSLSSMPLCRGGGCRPEQPTRLVRSEKQARNPAWSPDGTRIAFESTSSGHGEIWISDRDGSNARQWTHFNGPMTGTPRWAPDGKRLVFDSRVAGRGKIFLMALDGGKPVQLTSGNAEDVVPSWSRDGQWIYFASNRSGRFQVWKIRADGGTPVQVTGNGGFYAQESADGKTVYYVRDITETSVWKIPVAGGSEQRVIDSVSRWANFVPLHDGILYATGPARSPELRLLEFATGSSRSIARVDGLGIEGLAVSPDERTLVFSKRESTERDLMMMEPAK